MNSLSIRGTLSFCPVNPPRPCGKYVYQRVRAGLGNVAGIANDDLQLRAYVIPTDPQTPAQLARRAVFADAVAGWQSLTPAQRDIWRIAGAGRNLPAYQTYVSAYLRMF